MEFLLLSDTVTTSSGNYLTYALLGAVLILSVLLIWLLSSYRKLEKKIESKGNDQNEE